MGIHTLAYAKDLPTATETALTELNGDSVVPPKNGPGAPLPLVGIAQRLEGAGALDYTLIDSNEWPDGHELKLGDVQNELLALSRQLSPSETLSVKGKQSSGGNLGLFVALLVKTRDPEIAFPHGADMIAIQVSPTAGSFTWGSAVSIGPGQSQKLLVSHTYALVGIQADEGIAQVECDAFGASKPALPAATKPIFFPVGLPFSGEDQLKVRVASESASAVNVTLIVADLGPRTGAVRAPVARSVTPVGGGGIAPILGKLIGGGAVRKTPFGGF